MPKPHIANSRPVLNPIHLCLASLLSLMLACNFLPGPVESPAVIPSTSPPETPQSIVFQASPTPIPPSFTQTPTQIPVIDLSSELRTTLQATAIPDAAKNSAKGSIFGGIEGVKVIPLDLEAGRPSAWLGFTLGLRSYDPLENHFLVVYEHSKTGWEEINRLELENADILSPISVKQVRFGRQENQDPLAWLQVESGVGAHGGCFDLLSFDGRELNSVLANCASSPRGGELRDLNEDGVPEVLLNGSENYVFCYACGVRIFSNQVWRWDGEKMVEVQLARLPRPAPEELSQLNDRAIELAQAELWKNARQEIGKALDIAPQDPTVVWNAALIDLHAETRRTWAQQSPYPLLSLIFYGDYAAAMDILRPYNPNQLFNPRTPLVAGTVAEGWEQALKEWVALFADKALKAEPNLAAAYFLRGWASYIRDPKDPRAEADIQRAVQLDPSDPLFLDSAAFLKQ